jgi:hypothetical protein
MRPWNVKTVFVLLIGFSALGAIGCNGNPTPPPPAPICTPGESEACAYTGPDGTQGQGLCRAGSRQCNATGAAWGQCQGEVLPATEACTPAGSDEDCDGVVDNGCACSPNETQTCAYTGPDGTQGQGLCQAGSRQCNATGTAWGSCLGEVLPATEACTPRGLDEDCDGVVDDNCTCSPGETQTCAYTGPPSTLGQGVCRAGNRQCNATGTAWGTCQGEVRPTTEACTPTGQDEDCDGRVDETCACLAQEGNTCYGGPGGSETRGICQQGAIVCDAEGQASCQGEVRPRVEVCSTIEDDDCSGTNNCAPVSRRLLHLAGSGCERAQALATDSMGNLLLLGSFDGTINLAGTTLTGDTGDLFVVKLSPTGQHLWSHRIDRDAFTAPTNGAQEILAVDGAGNVLIAGGFTGALRVSETTLTSDGPFSSYVLKFSSTGTLAWARRLGGNTTSESWAMALTSDTAGNAVVAGWFRGNLILGSQEYSVTSGTGAYVTKLSESSGASQWSTIHVSSNTVRPLQLAMHATGDVLLAGSFQSQVDFGGGLQLTNATGAQDDYVARLTGSSGSPLWLRSPTTDNSSIPKGLQSDSAGHVWLLVWSVINMPDFILVKLDAEGQQLWSQRFTALSSQDDVGGLSLDGAGNAVATGSFVGGADFGGGSRSANIPAAFLAWYDTRLGYLSDRTFAMASVNNQVLPAKAVFESTRNVRMAGQFSGTVELGTGPVTSLACSDIFLLEVDPTP